MTTQREKQVIDSLVAGVQNTPEFLSLDPSVRLIANQAVRFVAENYAADLIKQVDGESNRQVNTIPNNTVGVNNPLNIVSGNQSSSQVSATIGPNVKTNLNGNISSKLSADIFDNLNSRLPPAYKSSVNQTQLRQGINTTTSSTVPNIVDNTISSFASNLMSGKLKFNPTVPNIFNLFSSNPLGALTSINQQFATSLSTEAINEARKFNTNNASNQEKLIVQSTGFIDPAAQYPTKEYQGRSEVNKLATGEVKGTIVQSKEKERKKGIQLPNGQSFEQPPIPFKGEYPFNKVVQTESGHIIETDDTPGAERIHIYHRSGTFVEIDANGTIVKRTKGSNYEIIDKNGYISVNGDANLSVKGSIKIYVGGNADIEVEGDTNINCFNDITMQASGRIDMSAREEINIHSANVNIEADVNLNVKSDNDSFYTAGREMHHKSNSKMYLHTLDEYNLLAEGSIFNQTQNIMHFKAAGTINADGSSIYWNSGTSAAATAGKYSINAKIGLIDQVRKDIVLTTIPDPISPSHLDKYGLNAEDSEFDSEGNEQQRRLKEIGVASSDDLNQSQIPLGTESPSSNNSTVIQPSNFVLSQTYLPDNFQLSKHFTLGQLSSKAVVSNYPLQAQLGLSYGEIAYNLQGIALNILEPVLALYPNMFVTSAFRSASNSSSLSDHPRGKAVDMQFKGVGKNEYFEIAKRLAQTLNYDKLLLEYKTYGTGMPWIHISFDVTQQRKQLFTYFNDKKYGSGLTNFA